MKNILSLQLENVGKEIDLKKKKNSVCINNYYMYGTIT